MTEHEELKNIISPLFSPLLEKEPCSNLNTPLELSEATWEKNKQTVPEKPGIYTIWNKENILMYVGIARNSLRERINAHYRGYRGGNQFAIYVGDWIVLKDLSRDQIEAITKRELFLNQLIATHIRNNFRVMHVKKDDIPTKYTLHKIEKMIKEGQFWKCKPVLNPSQQKEERVGNENEEPLILE